MRNNVLYDLDKIDLNKVSERLNFIRIHLAPLGVPDDIKFEQFIKVKSGRTNYRIVFQNKYSKANKNLEINKSIMNLINEYKIECFEKYGYVNDFLYHNYEAPLHIV